MVFSQSRHPQWAMLLAGAALFGLAFSWLSLPAPVLLGSLVSGVIFATSGVALAVPRVLFLFAQGVVGVLVASSLSHDTVGSISQNWSVFLLLSAVTLVTALLISWIVSRLTDVPTDAAIWGGLPGMASTMVAGAYESGADSRLVAFFQYVRVAEVMLVASFASHYLLNGPMLTEAAVHAVIPSGLAVAALIAALAIPASRLRWLPAAPVLVTIAVGAVTNLNLPTRLEVPNWLVMFANVAIGLQIGLCFTRETIWHVVKLIPAVVLSASVLIACSALAAYVLALVLGLDHLTAFLATTPGSIDLVAILAISHRVDVPFVMALQTTRLFLVVLVGPILARLIPATPSR